MLLCALSRGALYITHPLRWALVECSFASRIFRAMLRNQASDVSSKSMLHQRRVFCRYQPPKPRYAQEETCTLEALIS